MPLRIQQLPPGPTGIWEAIRRLQRDIAELRAARRRPYLPIPWAAARYTDWPASTAATWEDVHRATIARMQPYAYVVLATTSDDPATTGQVQLTINGVAYGAPIDVQFLQQATTIGPFALPGVDRDQVELRVQAQRTAGTGTVRCQILAASSLQPSA